MKIGALIPMRLRSERLPGKALLDLCGQPVCYHLLDRVVACKYISDPANVVVCTTEDPSDDPLVEAIENYGCSVFRGAKDDIIARFAGAVDAFGFDYVVQADGDDPLSATEYMDLTMEKLLGDTSIDIVTVDGLPLGCATKSFSKDAMEKVLSFYATEKNDTGFIYYFTKTGLCEHKIITCENAAHMHPTARLTLDYQDDFSLFQHIFNECYESGKTFDLGSTVEFLHKNPELIKLNSMFEEEYRERTREKAVLNFKSTTGKLSPVKI